MAEQLPPEPTQHRPRRRPVARKAVRLTGREYLPMAFTLAFWGVTAIGIGHADAARLLACTVLMRACYMLSQINTVASVRRRWHQSAPVRRQAISLAATTQFAVMLVIAAQIAGLSLALSQVGQAAASQMLPLVAIGLPARLWRTVDLHTQHRMFRMATTGSMLAGAGIAWLLGGGPLYFALAFGLREYVATILIRLLNIRIGESRRKTDEPLRFDELARNTVITSRRMITYRLTKNLLAVFGPFGNFAARTGRGLNYHSRLEPYMPHKRGGFAAFALLTATISVVLTLRSGKPLALIAGAGALQLCALALNVLLWWRYLPKRDDPSLIVEDDDDD